MWFDSASLFGEIKTTDSQPAGAGVGSCWICGALRGATHQQTWLFIEWMSSCCWPRHWHLYVWTQSTNNSHTWRQDLTRSQKSKSAPSQETFSIFERPPHWLSVRTHFAWENPLWNGPTTELMCVLYSWCVLTVPLKTPFKSRTCRGAENSRFELNTVTQASNLKLELFSVSTVFQLSKPKDPELCSSCGLWAPAAVYSALSVNDRGTIWSLLLMKCRKAEVTVQQMMGPGCRERETTGL